jgi:hypothetical protein
MKAVCLLTLSFCVYAAFQSSCKKQTSIPNCGCDGQREDSFSYVNGAIYYESINYFTRRPEYVLEYFKGTDVDYYYVCDTTFPALQSLMDTNRIISHQVTFSGAVENFCTNDTLGNIVGDSAYYIRLSDLTLY